jgi:hypothetical protein
MVCALLAGCGSDDLTAPHAAPSTDDVQCTEAGQCGGGGEPPPGPAYYWGSDTDISRAWKPFGTAYAFVTIHKGNSWSEVVSPDYASGRVDATAYTYYLCRTGSQATYGSQSRTVAGIGKAEVNFRFEHNTRYGFQVRGTHTFVGKPGVSTKTFYSENSHCDDGYF